MATVKIEKALIMWPAAMLTGGVISNLPDQLPLDVDLKDPNTRAENLMAWEVFRVFYHGIAKAMEDEANWPTPRLDASAIAGTAGGVAETIITKGLSALGIPAGVGQLAMTGVQLLVAWLKQAQAPAQPTTQPALPGNIPNPGDVHPVQP